MQTNAHSISGNDKVIWEHRIIKKAFIIKIAWARKCLTLCAAPARLILRGASDPGPDWGQGGRSQIPRVTCQWLGWHSCHKATQLSVVGWLPASLFWFLASRYSSCNFGALGWGTSLKEEVRTLCITSLTPDWKTEIRPRQGGLLLRLSETNCWGGNFDSRWRK